MGRVIEAFAQFLDSDGDPLRNGWLRFLESGTTNTDKTTYYDENFQIPNSNPLQLDGDGRCPNVFGTGNYKVISYVNDPEDEDSPGEMIQTFDPVTAQGATTGGGGGTAGFEDWSNTETYSIGDIVTYNNLYYRSLANGNIGNIPPATSSYWEQVDFLHYWNDTVYYEEGDLVYYEGALYFSKQNLNINEQPDESAEWWFRALTDYDAIEEKTDNYTITTADYNKLLVLGSTTAAAKTFELPATDATVDRFRVTFYNNSDYDLTIDLPLGSTDAIWLGTDLILKKGELLELSYHYTESIWVVERGNSGEVFNILRPTQIQLADSQYIYFGDGQDLRIYSDGTHGIIEAPTAYVKIKTAFGEVADFTDLGEVYFKGPNVNLPDNSVLNLGTGGDFFLYFNATAGYMDCTGPIYIRTIDANHIHFYAGGTYVLELEDNGNGYFKNDLYVAGTSTFTGKTTHSAGIRLNDNDILELGNSADMEIWHSGSHGYIDINTGELRIRRGTTEVLSIETDNDFNFSNNDLLGVTTLKIGSSNTAQVTGNGLGQLHLKTINADPIYFYTSDVYRWSLQSTGTFRPAVGNAYAVGSSTYRVSTVYCVTLDESSDINMKSHVEPIELGLGFLNLLNPVSYKWKDKKQNQRTRYGLIAQEVMESVLRGGLTFEDFSPVSVGEEEGSWGLEYSQFTAIIIKAIQEIDAKLKEHGII